MKKKNLLMTSIVLGALTVSSFAYAAEVEEVPAFSLEGMVVTATRTPVKEFDTQASVTVIDRKTLENKHYTDLGDALKDVPGVDLQNYGASGENYTSNRLYINGSTNIVVLIDGMRANVNGSVSSVLSPSEFSNLDTVERIEVLKGSASTLYGADAVGGVINIITRKAASGVNTTISAIGGSFDKQTYKIMNRGNVDGLYWMVSAQKNKMGDFKDGRGNKIIHDVDSEAYNVSLGKQFGANSDVSFTYSKYKSDYDRPSNGGLLMKDHSKGYKDNDKYSLRWDRKFNDKLSNVVSLYRNNNFLHDNSNNPGSKWVMDLATLGFSEQVNYKNANNSITAGFDFYQDRVNDYSSTSYGSTDAYTGKHLTNRAYFLQDNWEFAKGWNLTPGIRYTSTSEFGSNTSRSIAVGYNNGTINAYAGWKEFFVAPNQYQLYSKYGGKNLKPSEGKTIEAGVNYQINEKSIANFNVYRTHATNMIAFDNATYKYNNIANEKTYGWSLGYKVELNDNFTTGISYTRTRIPRESATKNENRDGYIPKGTINWNVDYTLSKLNANLSTRWIMDRPGRKVNEKLIPNSLKSFALFDLAVNYKPTKNIRAFAKVNNLFDKFYTDQLYDMRVDGSWYSAPGRSFQVGVEYSF